MRHARFVSLVASLLASGTLFLGCNESGPAGVYAYVEWRLRCEEMAGCSAYPDRFVDGFDGEGASISCNVTETAESRTLNFSAFSSSFGIQLQNAVFPRGGSAASGGCQVRVLDDNTYVGTCGGAEPTPAQPCQVNNVTFSRDDAGRALIRGQIYCVGISPTAAPTIDRELTAPGNSIEARTSPLTFDLYDCPGYQPD